MLGLEYTGWAKKVIPLVHYITLYERYHFFGPPCICGLQFACVDGLLLFLKGVITVRQNTSIKCQ